MKSDPSDADVGPVRCGEQTDQELLDEVLEEFGLKEKSCPEEEDSDEDVVDGGSEAHLVDAREIVERLSKAVIGAMCASHFIKPEN